MSSKAITKCPITSKSQCDQSSSKTSKNVNAYFQAETPSQREQTLQSYKKARERYKALLEKVY